MFSSPVRQENAILANRHKPLKTLAKSVLKSIYTQKPANRHKRSIWISKISKFSSPFASSPLASRTGEQTQHTVFIECSSSPRKNTPKDGELSNDAGFPSSPARPYKEGKNGELNRFPCFLYARRLR
jgi:hypothetical protein